MYGYGLVSATNTGYTGEYEEKELFEHSILEKHYWDRVLSLL